MRYQNYHGGPPHWWQLSYDTHRGGGRFLQALAAIGVVAAVAVILITALVSLA